MSYINQKSIKQFVHSKNKRISKDGLNQLDYKIERLLTSAIELTGSFKTIKAVEIEHARS